MVVAGATVVLVSGVGGATVGGADVGGADVGGAEVGGADVGGADVVAAGGLVVVVPAGSVGGDRRHRRVPSQRRRPPRHATVQASAYGARAWRSSDRCVGFHRGDVVRKLAGRSVVVCCIGTSCRRVDQFLDRAIGR